MSRASAMRLSSSRGLQDELRRRLRLIQVESKLPSHSNKKESLTAVESAPHKKNYFAPHGELLLEGLPSDAAARSVVKNTMENRQATPLTLGRREMKRRCVHVLRRFIADLDDVSNAPPPITASRKLSTPKLKKR